MSEPILIDPNKYLYKGVTYYQEGSRWILIAQKVLFEKEDELKTAVDEGILKEYAELVSKFDEIEARADALYKLKTKLKKSGFSELMQQQAEKERQMMLQNGEQIKTRLKEIEEYNRKGE